MKSNHEFWEWFDVEGNPLYFHEEIAGLGIYKVKFDISCEDFINPEFKYLVWSVYANIDKFVIHAAHTFISQRGWGDGIAMGDMPEMITRISLRFDDSSRDEVGYEWSIQISLKAPDWDTEYGFFVDYSNSTVKGFGGAT